VGGIFFLISILFQLFNTEDFYQVTRSILIYNQCS